MYRDELLVLPDLTSLLQALLLVEELLRLPQDVLQLSQLKEVFLQGLRVLVNLPKHKYLNQNSRIANDL